MEQIESPKVRNTRAASWCIIRWPRAWFLRVTQLLTPEPRVWRGAAWGGLAALIIILLAAAYGLFGHAAPLRFGIGAIFFLLSFALIGSILTLFLRVLRGVPLFFIWVLACALPALALMAFTAPSVSPGIFLAGYAFLTAAAMLGASLGEWTSSGLREASRVRKAVVLAELVLSLVLVAAVSVWLISDGSPRTAPVNAAALSAQQVKALDLPNPALPGPYSMRSLTYGSGSDRHRAEYGADVDLITKPVDGSKLIERWSSLRTSYWGFGPEALPINGRVWYPEGNGPFPLVLIVHGQHVMEDFSDPGYTYLGELLASRGFIAASVDENFLNLSPLVDLLIAQSLIEENDLRGWLLLEHLRAWRGWNTSAGNPFYQKVDMDQIALIGHSRGGEAVAIAAAFNGLSRAPDNAELAFDYHFHIRSVIGLAPVDGNYQPVGQKIALENVNYLVLHGAQDMDVFTFQGERQYERVRFTDGGNWFKAAVYIYGANHGQFNTVWGRKDLFEPIMRVFNLEQLLPAEDQQRAASTTISAFLEATLHGENGYRAFFQDLRRGKNWLPDTLYLNQYQDAGTQIISTFEEDIDLTSTTLAGGTQTGNHLALWREQPVRAKWQDLGSHAAALGWDSQQEPVTASYTIRLPEKTLRLDAESVLVFSMADANEDPTPPEDKIEKKPSAPRQPIDLTVEVIDRAGQSARLPLSHFMLLQPQLEGQLGKAAWMSPFPASEAVMQHFAFPLKDFAAANPAFDPAALTQVRFLFNRTESGVVLLDNLGFQRGE